MRLAWPPADGTVQMLPCRSTASVRPSGETATDIDVPSLTVTSINAGAGAGAPLSPATNASTPTANQQRRMHPPGNGLARILVPGSELESVYFARKGEGPRGDPIN